ncbi:MAG: hypothetical protein UU40_C0001G0052 [Candidatus Uhrbacteria bacterium GW2011_GWD2_41_121]|uniref:Uncharacterized protein n=1 Tax=Candidatus Uhrbacteria bacterium GW2011_GWC1_41_20 TaxID=1618983 RepID=A0A0G0XSM3_9BACT|nr:MAG: hypothetical protein UT52_C0001G0018 [Candidatus Uhrbacteria bacterium GW2011_GWE1_39_46]KKR64407.1 MAG: hypothetical protein UU04_C0002G0018 [Candidatus Uhrbacteria bacterium GW2011_GWC2_40_450]KKR89635.1 MAG: hypothetical protein UU36_C0021G0006 [Candidatus Uhrbacteria bacterium GW2011_GWE2_41_1153]KKR90714.1 MAG: hypothetical protein UU40_C0001G0052 [Candidatus Uhrbacteria bacterium GW2011_GWD2_41_121]KKR99960.1 MAG: hypothetical protein UU50_C0001G0018 [Candidatus Uhrbacteria bacter
MIGQLNWILAQVPAVLMQAVAGIFALWSGWAIWTVLMCSPIYLIAIGLSVFGIGGGTISTLVRRTVMVNAIAASLPISAPILALWYGVPFVYRLVSGQPGRRQNNQRPQTIHYHIYQGGQRPRGRRGGGRRPPHPPPPARP